MSKYQIHKYYLKDSYIHTLNPILKVITLILLSITSILIKNIYSFLISLTITITLLLLSKINIKIYIKSIYKIKILLIFIFIINIIFKINIFTNLLSIYKIINIVLISIMVTMTTPPTELTYALEKIMSPLNKFIKVKEISLMLTLAIRFIPSIIEQSERIIKAISVRGIDFKGSIKDKINIISILIIPMFTSVIRKSDATSDVMTLRMYNYTNNRTNYRMNPWKIQDTITLICILIFLLLEII